MEAARVKSIKKRIFLSSRCCAVVASLLVFFFVNVCSAEQFYGFSIVFPLMYPKLTSKFGARKHPIYKSIRHHSGVDLAAPMGSYVRSIASGKIVFADWYAGYGKLVTVEHKNGYYSLYGHLSEIKVNPGQQIKAGSMLGRVGSTGISTGPHLHFEWRDGAKSIDPIKVFPELVAEAKG